MRIKRACVFLAVLLCLSQSGCAVKGEDYLCYLKKGFCAEVRGELRGICFSAVIALVSEGEGYCVGVRYLSPEALEGLEVSAVCDAEGVPIGVGRVLLEGREGEIDATMVEGLLLPACAFLGRSEIAAIRYAETCCQLTLTDGTVLKLGEDGAPQSLQKEYMNVEVVWLEWSKDLDLLKK